MGVKVGPVVRKPREVFLLNDVIGVFFGSVETVQDNSDEQVQEHKRDDECEAGGGSLGWTVGKERGGWRGKLRARKRS